MTRFKALGAVCIAAVMAAASPALARGMHGMGGGRVGGFHAAGHRYEIEQFPHTTPQLDQAAIASGIWRLAA